MRDARGRFLLLKVLKNSSMHGRYDLPGGRIMWEERGMALQTIIARETKEELGADVRYRADMHIPSALGMHQYYSRRYKRMRYALWVFFEAKYLGGKIEISDEHEGFVWAHVNKKNLDQYFMGGALEGMKNYFIIKKK